MSNAILNEKGKNKEELQALETAEDARQKEWTQPSFVADLFMGKVNLASLNPFPEQGAEDKKIGDEYLNRLEKFMSENLDPDQVDRESEIPKNVMKGLADLGAFGLKIPKEYGGLGLSQYNYARVMGLVTSYCSSTTALLSAHQSIGVPQPLKLFGTKEQKQKYLPRFAKGEVSAFALTETQAGSDPAKMSTVATRSEDGKHFILNGKKLWCTNGPIADVLVVMAQSPSKMVNGREKKQITAFIVEKGMPGFEVVHRCRFMGIHGIHNGLLSFTNVKVPVENIILGEGQGLRLALVTLNAGRLSIPAGTVGGLKKLIGLAREWGNERIQWGAPVGKHEAGLEKLAALSTTELAVEAITSLCCEWVDRESQDIRLEAAMAKVFGTVHGYNMVDRFLQLRGGRGYETASSLKARGEKPIGAERYMRDARINTIIEGTTEILTLFIAREALDKHLKIANDLLSSKTTLGQKFSALIGAACFYSVWYPRQWIYCAFWPMFSGYGILGKHMRYLIKNTHRLARTMFHLMVLNGPKLEKKQLQLMRVVEIATDLFAMAATIGKADAMAKRGQSPGVLDVANLFCYQARARIDNNFRSIWNNYDCVTDKVGMQVLEGKMLWQEERF
jgi:alkylation response protein AidB-like acyl-CoA dehydrogenase